ncbi:hypothetical protein TWF718_007865 [Orbilia javanica]|uniref:Uncharacterized protein n=1 Tax=Orbilia javanica TaxID=47235 RepID=A0AAN8RC01_9PEZI
MNRRNWRRRESKEVRENRGSKEDDWREESEELQQQHEQQPEQGNEIKSQKHRKEHRSRRTSKTNKGIKEPNEHKEMKEHREGPPEKELNITGPDFARLEPSPAKPDGLPDVNTTASLVAPRWDDKSEDGNPLVQAYEGVCGGPAGNEHEGRILNFLDIYDVPKGDVEKVASLYLPFGFAQIKFATIAKFLNIRRVEEIQYLRIHRSRVNIHYFNVFQDSFLQRAYKYGIKTAFGDPSRRGVLVVELLYELTGMLPVLEFNPGSGLGGGIGYPSARAKEAVFTSLGVDGLVYVAVDPKAEKRNDSDGAARLLAELAVCNYRNIQAGKWVPMLGLLSDGYQFQFWVYSSTARKIWASHWIPGFNDKLFDDMEGFLISLKIVLEYLYDFFISMVHNSMRIGLREVHRAVTNDPTNEELVREAGLGGLAVSQCGEAHFRARKAESHRSNDMIAQAEREIMDAGKFMVASLEYWLGTIKVDKLPPNVWERGPVLSA